MTNGILPQQAKIAWAIFAGVIDQTAVNRFFALLGAATANQIERVHLLFQSTGGTVSDGVCLYNFLHALPIEIGLYNVGTVASAGALAYLGAKVRKVSATGTFMLHRTQASPLVAIKLANDGIDTRALQHFLGHRNIRSGCCDVSALTGQCSSSHLRRCHRKRPHRPPDRPSAGCAGRDRQDLACAIFVHNGHAAEDATTLIA